MMTMRTAAALRSSSSSSGGVTTATAAMSSSSSSRPPVVLRRPAAAAARLPPRRGARVVTTAAADGNGNGNGGGGWLSRVLSAVLGGGGDGAQQQQDARGGAAVAVADPPATASPQQQAQAGSSSSSSSEEVAKSDDYTADMQQKMGTSLTYRHEDGVNYHFVLPDLIVGSCLQGPEDADRLQREAGVTTVFSLQEDCDMEYFNIDVAAIQARCKELGVRHVRFPVRDFDPYDLRRKLPKAVTALAKAHSPKDGVVYIHCTAGLGRAPATALAYMYWLRGWQLPEALASLTSVRRCSPRVEAIRAATADLLTDSRPLEVTIGLRRRGTVQRAQVAGLDVGWHSPLDLAENPRTRRLEVTRTLLPGSYPFKFVLDGAWCANLDYPTYQDGDNLNNMLTVLPRDADDNALRERLLSPTGGLGDEERRVLARELCPWSSHDDALHGLSPSASSMSEEPASGDGGSSS